MKNKLDDPVWLVEQYATRSIQAIADELGVHRNTVRNRMVTFGIERRQRGLHFRGKLKSPEQIERMALARLRYWEQHPDRTLFKLKMSKSKTKTQISNKGRRIYVLGRGRVMEHVYIMEQMMGRRLQPDEQVHHRDGNRLNNMPENLELLTNSDHQVLHNKTRPRDAGGRFVKHRIFHLPPGHTLSEIEDKLLPGDVVYVGPQMPPEDI